MTGQYTMEEPIRQLCEAFLAGGIPSQSFLQLCLRLASERGPAAQVDLHRETRCGFPEVIFGEGKSAESLQHIVMQLEARGQCVLATRLTATQQEMLTAEFPGGIVNRVARTFRLMIARAADRSVGKVAVITAGTSDLPVSLEAQETLAWMGVSSIAIDDVGVAGPHRLPAHLDLLEDCDAVVVIAGMEGALPSVVGGYLNCPIIAVPTSVGYGASFQGVAALLGMLNSCASNVAVVNIDAGFKGAYLAGMIAHRRAMAARELFTTRSQ